MTDSENSPTLEERVAALEEQLRGMDDAVAQRCLLVLSITNTQHQQFMEQVQASRADIEQLISAGRSSREDIDQLISAGKSSREDMEQLISAGRSSRKDINNLTDTVKTSQSNIELLAERMGQLAQDIADFKQFQRQSIEQANQDRAQAHMDRLVMMQILQFLQNQHPGNGKGGN